MRIFYSITDTKWLTKNILYLVTEPASGSMHMIFSSNIEQFNFDDIKGFYTTKYGKLKVVLKNGSEYTSNKLTGVNK